ncbi:hypothetical protein C1T17_15560 [Sphingobium sp. SCG-1]|uniref:TetR/AcrR family transcriptional regulator n=1 Tax=Sphingobium sp. SCG-1 TaxID=2072936 RepID=UPI000CD68B1C|nr:TetR/AcrR family transcriptional regulator [Sphingobium sp. SCG-1]AUW59294.1 hypothetical protein C1T17_15560 [Sphingobium sp. SCG-1]
MAVVARKRALDPVPVNIEFSLEAPAPFRGGRRRLRTREALMAAGRKLFAEHPLDAVAVDDVIGAASVAKGSFYNHFSDKDALLSAIVAEIRRAMEVRIVRINEGIGDPAARIARAICTYSARVADYPTEGLILLRDNEQGSFHQPLNKGLKADLEVGFRNGRLALPSLDAGLLYVLGVAQGVLLAAVRNPSPAHTIADTQLLCMMLLRSFGLAHPEPELIAARAADEIIRLRTLDRED